MSVRNFRNLIILKTAGGDSLLRTYFIEEIKRKHILFKLRQL